jgi:AcrR family transcriptional regulator
VLEAAAQVITEQGYAAMTTNAVARRAGVSIGSLYQYFPNKAAILVCLLERHIREMQPVIAKGLEALADPGRPFEDALRDTLLRFVAAHDHHGPRLQQVLSEEVPHPPSIERLRRKLEAGYVTQVAGILRGRGEFPLAQAEIVAQLFVVVARPRGAPLDRPARLRGRGRTHARVPPAVRRGRVRHDALGSSNRISGAHRRDRARARLMEEAV